MLHKIEILSSEGRCPKGNTAILKLLGRQGETEYSKVSFSLYQNKGLYTEYYTNRQTFTKVIAFSVVRSYPAELSATGYP